MTVNEILSKYGTQVTYLNPGISTSQGRRSKIGGHEYFVIEEIDRCPTCNTRMTSIIDIFQDEYPECYFPPGKDYLLVKTCYSPTCEFNEDVHFHIGFGNSTNLTESKSLNTSFLPEAFFNPIKSMEIPLMGFGNAGLESIIESLGRPQFEDMMENYFGVIGSKLNGEPYSFQELTTPICTCGKRKHHLLQISSYEPNLHLNDKRKYWEWDPSLGVFIGNVGNYHFYVCLNCGEHTVEHNWDCI